MGALVRWPEAVGKGEAQSKAQQFAEGKVPLMDFWAAMERGEVGRGVVLKDHVEGALVRTLEGHVTGVELAAWAGTLLACSCFVVASRRARAVLTRLAMTEMSEANLRGLLGRLREGEENTVKMRRVV